MTAKRLKAINGSATMEDPPFAASLCSLQARTLTPKAKKTARILSLETPKLEPDLIMIEKQAIMCMLSYILKTQIRELLCAHISSYSRAELNVVRYEDPPLVGFEFRG